MQLKTTNILAGLSLALVVSAGALCPAMADDSTAPAGSSSSTTQSYSTEGTRGTIASIVGGIVTLRTTSGETKTYWLSKEEIGRYNLIPGQEVIVSEKEGATTVAMYIPQADVATSVTAARILAIRSEVVARSPETTETTTTTTTATETTAPTPLPAVGGNDLPETAPRALW
ncbi:MAG: hypothetical protein KME17_12975 [Cyanosarcina radialis HA8281-LM2]|nr:hypothetical protein [Cyanosarcina radialis HA8281-LM2]